MLLKTKNLLNSAIYSFISVGFFLITYKNQYQLMPSGNKCHVDAWIIKESNKRSVHLPHLWEQNYCFPFLKSWLLQSVKKKEKRRGKKACVMNPNQLWQWAPQGSIIAGKQQLLRSCTCWLRMSTKIWICVCEWPKSLPYDVGKLWNCVLVVWTYLAWDTMPSSDLLSFSGPYFDIFYPTSNPIVKYCHLDFAIFPKQVKSNLVTL